VSSTASCAAPTGRVLESLPGLRGAFIIASTPCSCVLVLGTNIAVLLPWALFEVVRQSDLTYFLPYFLSKLHPRELFSTSGGYCDYTAPFPATPSSRLRASGSKGSVNPPLLTFRWISLPQTRAPMRRLALLALLVSAASGFLIPTMPARSGISVARHTHAVMNAPVGRGVDGQPRRKGEPPACV
jgi:hypothetical protein